MARPRVGEPDGHLPLDVIAVETGEHLQLFEFVGATARAAVEIGELFARRDQAGLEGDRLFLRPRRVGDALLLAQAQAEQVVRVGHAVVQANRLADRGRAPPSTLPSRYRASASL